MPWMCPAFKRPHRLAELAVSWEEHCEGYPLYVRIWSGDPFKDEYFATSWPRGWKLYESEFMECGPSLQEFAEKTFGEPIGFLGDDCLIRTPNAPRLVEEAAGDWFLAWPNDMLQRHRLPIHFCVGPKLLEALEGKLVLPGWVHAHLDDRLLQLALNTGLQRYMPHVVIYHNHPYKHPELRDSSFTWVEQQREGFLGAWKSYLVDGLAKEVVQIRRRMLEEFEGVEEG